MALRTDLKEFARTVDKNGKNSYAGEMWLKTEFLDILCQKRLTFQMHDQESFTSGLKSSL